MLNFTFETQGVNTYLVYPIAPDDVVDSMSLGMLTNNKIPGLASTLFTQMDTTKYIKYNVSAKVSIKQFFIGAINKKRLLGVFNGIVSALLSAEDYMLDGNSLLLDLDYIFTDVSTYETVLICLPIQGAVPQYDLNAFFKEIMFSTQFDQTENCDYVARIINYLNSASRFSVNDFKSLLDDISSKRTTVQKQQIEAEPNHPNPTSMSVQSVEKKIVSKPPESISTDKKEEVILKHTSSTVAIPTVSTPPASKSPCAVTVPKQSPTHQLSGQENQDVSNSNKRITMLGLLMHYSKENAELYKSQKEEKKKSEQSVKKDTSTVFSPASNHAPAPSYAIPGQSSMQSNFAVPHATTSSAQSVQQLDQPSAQPQVSTFTGNSMSLAVGNNSPKTTVSSQITPPIQSVNFGETTILGAGMAGETTVLMAGKNPEKVISPHLIRSKNNEQIPINKPVFRVGKERSYVDYFVGDNTAISRSHANFITRDGEYFVVDTNSTNHTFVNGTMIQSNVETRINHGDIIRLANEDFEFRIY